MAWYCRSSKQGGAARWVERAAARRALRLMPVSAVRVSLSGRVCFPAPARVESRVRVATRVRCRWRGRGDGRCNNEPNKPNSCTSYKLSYCIAPRRAAIREWRTMGNIARGARHTWPWAGRVHSRMSALI